jgi:hypothetical protein
VSRICAELDAEVAALADRDVTAPTFRCVFLDATHCKAWVGGPQNGKGCRVASQAVLRLLQLTACRALVPQVPAKRPAADQHIGRHALAEALPSSGELRAYVIAVFGIQELRQVVGA